jgi:3-hydroxyacyl-CoA dehydrogenase/enoyl-CoA hydratase/carnithine racemase
MTRFTLQAIDRIALVTLEGEPAVLGRVGLESLAGLLPELEGGDWDGLVLTGTGLVFCAGADIDEFPGIDAERARAGSRAGHELFGRIRALPYPTLAAINGACLGGGVELALHCDARTISSTVGRFACPEVFLSLVPGWGGTQLVPRLVGPEAAVRLVVTNPLRQNRMLHAHEAHEVGLVDRLFEPASLLDESLRLARDLASNTVLLSREEPDWSETEAVFRRARARVNHAVHGATPAPYRALELIQGAAEWTLEEGYRREEDAIAELLPGRRAQASIYAFDLVSRHAKRGIGIPETDPRPVRKVGIAGAGLMATQIATLFVRRLEVPLVLRDLEQEIVDRALASIREELPEAAARVSGTTGYDGFEDCDVVLEAVVERLDAKRQVFTELRERVRPDAVLLTNTSSLSVAEIGADAGLHFFNPVALMPLVEIARHADTSDAALATAWDMAQRLGKRGVVVADAPGFVVNRVLTRFTRVLMDALEHGNTVEEVDEAVLSLGMPLAPSVLLQMVGPQLARHVLEAMHAAFPERFPLSPALDAIALGDDPPVLEHRPRTREAIIDDALSAVADEIFRLLEDGVVADAKDVDTCLLLGAGWPFFMGGATRYLDDMGISEGVGGRTFDRGSSGVHG